MRCPTELFFINGLWRGEDGVIFVGLHCDTGKKRDIRVEEGEEKEKVRKITSSVRGSVRSHRVIAILPHSLFSDGVRITSVRWEAKQRDFMEPSISDVAQICSGFALAPELFVGINLQTIVLMHEAHQKGIIAVEQHGENFVLSTYPPCPNTRICKGEGFAFIVDLFIW